jgi:hypothetical protein
MKQVALIAKGRTAEVYLWGDNRVLKLFHDWCPRKAAQRMLELLSIFLASYADEQGHFQVIGEVSSIGV